MLSILETKDPVRVEGKAAGLRSTGCDTKYLLSHIPFYGKLSHFPVSSKYQPNCEAAVLTIDGRVTLCQL